MVYKSDVIDRWVFLRFRVNPFIFTKFSGNEEMKLDILSMK